MSRNIFIIIAASIDDMYQFLFPESIGWGDTTKQNTFVILQIQTLKWSVWYLQTSFSWNQASSFHLPST